MKRIYLSLLACIMVYVGMAQYDQLTNIPTIYIETFAGQHITSKENYIYATMTYVDGENMVQYDSLQIRGRGNSTWNLAKKPYRIKFNESTKFLGKGYAKNKSWTLLANHADKSLLRNAVTFAMGNFLGQPFSPAAHFVDLVINGTYLGNYQVSDQINVDNKRVEIYEQEEVATDDSNITGGYLLEIDGFGTSEKVNFRTSKNLIISVKSPDEDVINTAQKNYIRQYLNDFEATLFSPNFTDATNGYRAIVDSATLMSWYIATELSANIDGFWSTYIYKDQDDPHLYFGPLWDYDIAYNNCNRVGDVTNQTMINAGFGSDLTKVWMKQMIQDPWFNTAVNKAWKQKLNEGLEEYLYQYIDSMAAHIDESQEKNYKRYSISTGVYNEIYLYSTYSDYIDQLKQFIAAHTDFLSDEFAKRANDTGGDDDIPVVTLKPFALQEDYYYRIYNRGTNKVVDIANSSTEENAGIVTWSPEYGRDTQLWQIVKVGDYYQLINKVSGMAFNDPSFSSATGTQLNVAIPNANDSRQLWKFVTINENDNYNIINVYTDHVANNSGGNAADGNSIISYTNDERNAVSNNRQWRITPEELIPDYISEEVKEALTATISEAEKFLSSLTDKQVGRNIFCYHEEQIELLRKMVQDAKIFESTIADDYILTNVNLAKQLAQAQQKVMPDTNCRYTIRHKISGYYLDIETNKLCVTKLVNKDASQRFSFEQAGNNGVYLKADNGLYVMLGDTNGWTMVGQTSISNKAKATFEVSIVGDCYHIYTINGLLGTNDITENSTVYGDKYASNPNNVTRAEWIIEEIDSDMEIIKDELESMIEKALDKIAAIDKSWIGDNPMQLSQANIDTLNNIIEEAKSSTYTSIEDYEEMIFTLSEAMNKLHVLNTPNDKDYYLQHISAYNLSCDNGLTLAVADTLDITQRFRLIPVEGTINTYYIYTNGMYVTITDQQGATLALTNTPRDQWGEFVASQVSSNAFTLQSAFGYFGTKNNQASAGTPCIANAQNKVNNIRWQLIEATNTIIENGIDPADYTSAIDYAVIYNKDTETIRFVSDDMDMMSDVEVYVYSVGGRRLYCFKACEQQSVTDLPSGTYIIQWTWQGISRSIKFKK